MFDRTIKLIGEENFNKITNTTVAVIGIGGVGGYAVESLIRSGISSIILVLSSCFLSITSLIVSSTFILKSSKTSKLKLILKKLLLPLLVVLNQKTIPKQLDI